MTLMSPWHTIQACDGGVVNKPHTRQNKINTIMAHAILQSIGGHREKSRVVTSITVSEGKMCAQCFDKNGEHICDLSWRPTREGWFISG